MVMLDNNLKKKSIVASVALCVLMVSSAAFTHVITPTEKLADQRPALDLEKLVPVKLGDGWEEDIAMRNAVVNPQTEEALKKIYTQTLSRTYINRNGERVMLSIAYGSDQGGESTQAHRPEICYTAQGFGLKENNVGVLKTQYGEVPVRRLVAVNGLRNEPITYWVTVGDKATLPGFRRKLAQMAYGLNGTIPDGLIFRVSSIQENAADAYKLQDQFVNALFNAITPAQRTRLAGDMSSSAKAAS
jgi:EpsI family protein